MKKRFIIKTFLLINLVLLSAAMFISPAAGAQAQLESLTTTEEQGAGALYIGGQYAVCTNSDCTEAKINQTSSQLDAIAWGLINRLNTSYIPLYTSEGQPVMSSTNSSPVYIKKSGAIAGVMNYSQQMYTNPSASGLVYAQQEWNKITKGHKAYAQDAEDSWIYYPGLGFNILKPVQDFWIITRNVAYLAMILIIIVVAFLVAFRSNFGGQTQVTIANSIPNIVIALVMITISYPLSGLAIDIITIGSNLAQQILIQNEFSPGYYLWDDNATLDRLPPADDLTNPKIHLQPDDAAMSVWQSFLTANVNVVQGEDGVASVVPQTEILGGIVDKVLEALEHDATNLLVQVVFVLSAFMASLKLFFKLIGKYLILVLYPVVSPFVMLTIAIPGQGTKAIAKYFKTLLAASLGFVAVYAVFLFMVVIGHHPTFGDQLSLTPPLLGYSPDQAQDAGQYIKMILAFALFLTTPVIPDVIDQALDTLPAYAEKMAPGQRIRAATIGGAAGGFLGTKNLVTSVAHRVQPGGQTKKQ